MSSTPRGWTELRDLLDLVGVPALIAGPGGTVLHVSEALRPLLSCDAEPDPLKRAIDSLIRSCLRAEDGEAAPGAVERDVRAGNGKYRVCGMPYRPHRESAAPRVIVSVEHCAAVRSSPQELRSTYALTAAEVKVAFLLLRGLANSEIASALEVSQHTARRHTERVLRKLGVRSRAEVADRLLD